MTEFDKYRVQFEDLAASSSLRQVPNPPGYTSHTIKEASTGSSLGVKRKESDVKKKQQALESRALAPWKQVGVVCFMMYMTSNSIQIFSLLTTFSGVATSAQAIITSADKFRPDAGGQLDVFTPRLLFCLIHMVAVICGLYKLNSIGLLPTHASDWFSALSAPSTSEYASLGIS